MNEVYWLCLLSRWLVRFSPASFNYYIPRTCYSGQWLHHWAKQRSLLESAYLLASLYSPYSALEKQETVILNVINFIFCHSVIKLCSQELYAFLVACNFENLALKISYISQGLWGCWKLLLFSARYIKSFCKLLWNSNKSLDFSPICNIDTFARPLLGDC